MSVEQRRNRLITAAIAVMNREGVSRATTRAICAEAEMPHGVFHYCFHSKRDLYAAVLATDSEVDLESVWPKIVPRSTPKENLDRLLLAYWEDIEADPAAQLTLFDLSSFALHDPELQELPKLAHAASLRTICNHMKRFSQEAQVALTVDEHIIARLVCSTLEGVTWSWLSDRDGAAARTTLSHFADSISSSMTSVSDSPDTTRR